MVIFCMKFDILPDKQQAYLDWLTTGGIIETQLRAPGITDLQGFRPVAGSSQVLGIYRFADMAAFSAWFHSEGVQQVLREGRTLLTNLQQELWEASALSPDPLPRID